MKLSLISLAAAGIASVAAAPTQLVKRTETVDGSSNDGRIGAAYTNYLYEPKPNADILIRGGGFTNRLEDFNVTISWGPESSDGTAHYPTSISKVTFGLQGPASALSGADFLNLNSTSDSFSPYGILQLGSFNTSQVNETVTVPGTTFNTALGNDAAGQYYLVVREYQTDIYGGNAEYEVTSYNRTVNLKYEEGQHAGVDYGV